LEALSEIGLQRVLFKDRVFKDVAVGDYFMLKRMVNVITTVV
jgi:hypothetical protein